MLGLIKPAILAGKMSKDTSKIQYHSGYRVRIIRILRFEGGKEHEK